MLDDLQCICARLQLCAVLPFSPGAHCPSFKSRTKVVSLERNFSHVPKIHDTPLCPRLAARKSGFQISKHLENPLSQVVFATTTRKDNKIYTQ